MPISWYTVIFKFRSIFATDERIIMSGIAFHYNALGNSVEPCFFCWHGSMGFPKTQQWKAIPNIILRPSVTKIKQNLKMTVLTNGHRIKSTQSNLMILVSFSSAGVAWFEDVKRYGTFRSQATKNLPFRFLWDTWYSIQYNSQIHNYNTHSTNKFNLWKVKSESEAKSLPRLDCKHGIQYQLKLLVPPFRQPLRESTNSFCCNDSSEQ